MTSSVCTVHTDDARLGRTEGPHETLPLHRDSLWVRKRRVGKGMAIGGLVSTVALGVLACRSSCAGVLWPGLAILPLPGVLVGSLVGSRRTHWEQRFPH